MAKNDQNSFFSLAENPCFGFSFEIKIVTRNGDEHFHFFSEGTLSKQKLQPQLPGRYQTINNMKIIW